MQKRKKLKLSDCAFCSGVDTIIWTETVYPYGGMGCKIECSRCGLKREWAISEAYKVETKNDK